MDKPPPGSRPTVKDRALAEHAARQAREAAALRANLLRRKAQARSRAAAPPAQAPPEQAPPEQSPSLQPSPHESTDGDGLG